MKPVDAVDQILEEAGKLTPSQRERLVGLIMGREYQAGAEPQALGKRGKWKGIYAGLGPVPTLEDIREVRREAWPTE